MATPIGDSYTCASGGVIAAGRYALPAWLRSIPSQRWGLVGNTLASIDPEDNPAINPNYPADAPWHANTGQPDVVGGWGGAAWDETNQKLRITGGGHAGYAGNEVYDWLASSGQFVLATKPTGAIGNTGTLNDGQEATGKYFDGQPRSAHTYNNLVMRNGEFWNFGGSTYTTGGGDSRPFRLTGSGLTYVLDADVTIDIGQGGVCLDTYRDLIWVFRSIGTYVPTKYNPVTHTVASHNAWVGTSEFVRPHYHAGHDLLVFFTQAGMYAYDPKVSTGSTDSFALTTSGTAPSFVTDLGKCGSYYDAANDRYLVWGGGTAIYTLTPPATNPATNAWVWGTLPLDGGNTVDPGIRTNAGTYGRFWYSPSLQCCGVFNQTTQQMAVYRM